MRCCCCASSSTSAPYRESFWITAVPKHLLIHRHQPVVNESRFCDLPSLRGVLSRNCLQICVSSYRCYWTCWLHILVDCISLSYNPHHAPCRWTCPAAANNHSLRGRNLGDLVRTSNNMKMLTYYHHSRPPNPILNARTVSCCPFQAIPWNPNPNPTNTH